MLASLHILLNKREPRAALGWVAFCLIAPFAGPIVYFLLGINRVEARARELRGGTGLDELRVQAANNDGISSGNQVWAVFGGDQAYPEMLRCIAEARESVWLSQYIFEASGVGQHFVEALSDAHKRGVTVRVLIDGVGSLYGLSYTTRQLRKLGVTVAKFLPLGLRLSALHINLRNHRKLLIVDSCIAYTGGMNIRPAGVLQDTPEHRAIVDTLFGFKGPCVADLEAVFFEDWQFSSGEYLLSNTAELAQSGAARCRVSIDGPNNAIDTLSLRIQSAIAGAGQRIRIQTPYFLPTREIVGALQVAALRGVSVEVLLPQRNNLPYVHWATQAMLWELLQYGVRVHYTAGAFDHSKAMVIDEQYSLIGSANIDPRSLRLNFEIGVEIWCQDLASQIHAQLDTLEQGSVEACLATLADRSLLIRIRDSLAWLFSPYL